ncbi:MULTISPECIES: phage tail family protein [Clostridium]|uniref:phage tail family protein n=1 Tax=Clostridium TaxID=1485 RepID=UPI001F262CD2|nr:MULTISPECIES: phage tail family protein [Clostridium]
MKQILKFISIMDESIEFSLSKPFLLKSIEGLNDVGANHITYKGINQDGEKYRSTSIEVREINIKFIIVANNSNELLQLREIINKVFNPKLGEGKLIYTYGNIKREIKCVTDGTAKMQIKGNKRYCEGEINLLSYDPYWKDIIKESEIIATFIGGWRFKFRLPFKFKQRGEAKKNIINQGHVDTPIEIIFKGPALNPCVINNKTGEFIKVTRELTSDDILYITTEYGNKKVEIERNGVRSNAFNYIDLDSTFFQLKVGDNMIEYTTDNNLEPQSVEIRYRNRYLGV